MPLTPISNEEISGEDLSWNKKFPFLSNLLHYAMKILLYVTFSIVGIVYILVKGGKGLRISDSDTPIILALIAIGAGLGIFHAHRSLRIEKLHDDNHHGF